MRINLAVPYEEKNGAKQLGARWDSARKTWYIVDVEDLTPFIRWIPTSRAPTAAFTPPPQRKKMGDSYRKATKDARSFGTTVPDGSAISCGCNVLPWEDCEHTTSTETA